MYINHFEKSIKTRLNQILNTLESVHGITIKMDLTGETAKKSLLEYRRVYETKKNEIIAESSFNSYQQNPEYIKSMLVLEAVKLMLTEIGPKRRRRTKTVSESVQLNEKESALSDLIGQAIEATGSYGTDWNRVNSVLQKIRERARSYIGNDHPAMGSIIKALSSFNSIPKDANGSDAFRTVLADLRTAQKDLIPTPAESIEEVSDIEEGTMKDLGAWLKKSGKEFWNGTPEELDQERKDKEAYKKHVRSKIKNKDIDENLVSTHDQQKNIKLGHAMVDYAEKAKPSSTEEVAMMNAFTRVGDKLIHIGTPFGPKGLDDTEQKIARYAALKLRALEKNNSAQISESIGSAHNYDYQASMARSELYRNTKYAMSLMKQIDPHGEVNPWIAASLEKAKTYLDKIYHYLEYKSTFEPATVQTEMDEDMDLQKNNGEAVRHSLTEIAEYSIKIFEMIEPDDKLEGWVAMKLTTASECISSCKHYMDYNQFEKHGLDNHFMEGRRMSRRKMAESLLIEQDQEELAKAQTILAAKDMSSKLQGMAEDVAKMAVEDLMPLVDVMRSQFGPEAADGFNQSAKSALESLLNATTTTKEQFDTALDTLSTGGVPMQQTDIGNASPMPGADQTVPNDASDMSADLADLANDNSDAGMDDELDGGDMSGAPLGRSKKPALGEAWKTEKKPSKDDGKWKNKTVAELRSIKNKLMSKKTRTADEQKKVKELNFAIRSKTGWGKVDESVSKKSCGECGKKFESTSNIKKCNDHKKLSESAPPVKKAEDFITNNKKEFTKRYGKDSDKILYATAWKNFGPKSEAFTTAVNAIAEQKVILRSLEEDFSSHKEDWKKLISEGNTIDTLNIGYGLEGNVIRNQIIRCTKKINEAKNIVKNEMTLGIQDMFDAISATSEIKKLSEMKSKTPYGVIYKTKNGQKHKKMFESTETRDYWLGLKKNDLVDVRLINPDTFDRAIKSII